jgi:hypothetical protein
MNHTCSQLAGGKREAIVEKESDSRARHTQLKTTVNFINTCQNIIFDDKNASLWTTNFTALFPPAMKNEPEQKQHETDK